MANNFKGYLLQATATSKDFPLEYIKWDTYSSTPNQREEIKAYRNENTRNLTRITAAGKKTKISFTIRPLQLDDKIKVQKWFTDAESDSAQRKISLKYWNDEDNSYKTGSFYRPDIEFKIKKIEGNNIWYDELPITLVEY